MIFACIDDNSNVFNLIVADSLEIAEFVSNSICIELDNDSKKYVEIDNCKYINGEFVPQRPPYPSWSWDGDAKTWKSPKEKPDSFNRYYWEEESNNWILDTSDAEYNA
jgi:hypothetical protein